MGSHWRSSVGIVRRGGIIRGRRTVGWRRVCCSRRGRGCTCVRSRGRVSRRGPGASRAIRSSCANCRRTPIGACAGHTRRARSVGRSVTRRRGCRGRAGRCRWIRILVRIASTRRVVADWRPERSCRRRRHARAGRCVAGRRRAVVLPAAMPEGFTGEPTGPGVAAGVDWNGLLFQNAKLGAAPSAIAIAARQNDRRQNGQHTPCYVGSHGFRAF